MIHFLNFLLRSFDRSIFIHKKFGRFENLIKFVVQLRTGMISGIFWLKDFKMIKIGDKKYMSIEDYAKQQGKTIQTIYNWIKEKKVNTRQLLGKTVVEL